MQARGLISRDVRILAAIINDSRDDVRQLLKDFGPELKALTESKPGEFEEERMVSLATEVTFALLGQVDNGLWPWLADMGGVTPEQLDKAPIPDLVGLIVQIFTQEDWPDFLGQLQSIVTGSPVPISSKRATGGVTPKSKSSRSGATPDSLTG